MFFSQLWIHKSRPETIAQRRFVLVYETFGPPMADRCEALAHAGFQTLGLELYGKNGEYDWHSASGQLFDKKTLFPGNFPEEIGFWWTAYRLSLTLLTCERSVVIFCHYDRLYILLAAIIAFLRGHRIYLFMDSKFDDYHRVVWRELVKRLFVFFYRGAIVASPKSQEYVKWLGMKDSQIWPGSCSISTDRIRSFAVECAPPFEGRPFIIISRFVEKKNLDTTLRAYASYARFSPRPRKMLVAGSGPLELQLRQLCIELEISSLVSFLGFLQSPEVSRLLSESLCLVHLSKSEQFGIVISESLALGIPVIVSTECGARYALVETGVNGFIVEPDNIEGVAQFMTLLSEDSDLWHKLRKRTEIFSDKNDVQIFVESARAL